MAIKGTSMKVDTRPSKGVVVSGLTKDISVKACIFDLIDNSIDAARNALDNKKQAFSDQLPESYKGFRVKLSLDGEAFKIEDNCGGIRAKDLEVSVLRFGKSSSHNMGIGVFGVGLNRALFKLGTVIKLSTDTGSEYSELSLNTGDYIGDDDDWNIPAIRFPSRGVIGTEITITKIEGEISQQFADRDWVDSLRDDIGKIYARFLKKGLSIVVNKKTATSGEIALRENGPHQVESKYYKDGDVSIFIECGQHLEHRFSNESDYDIEKNRELTDQYGWTILCNDRAIKIADTSDKTGWDTKFHSEFYGFVGYVNFVSVDPAKLPWTTTKTDIDLNNHAYRQALADMRKFAENWRTTAGKRKKVSKPTPIPPKPKGRKKTTRKESANPPPKRTAPAAPPKEDHHDFRTVLPGDVEETYCTDKHLALVHEAKKLDLAEMPYIGMGLIRILFEISVSCFLHRHQKFDELKQFAINARRKAGQQITPQDEKNIFPKMEEILPYFINHPDVWGGKQQALKHSLTRMVSHAKLLNGAVHNPFQIIDRSEAFKIRNEVLPVLRHLIEH